MTTSELYGQFTFTEGKAKADVSSTGSSIVKLMLVGPSYTPAPNTHAYRSDITGEISGSGYSTGGTALINPTWTYDSTNKWTVLSADPTTFYAIPATVRYGIMYYFSNTGAANDPLIGYIDFEGNIDLTSKSLILNWSSSGIFRSRKGPVTP